MCPPTSLLLEGTELEAQHLRSCWVQRKLHRTMFGCLLDFQGWRCGRPWNSQPDLANGDFVMINLKMSVRSICPSTAGSGWDRAGEMVWSHLLTIPWGDLSLLCPLNFSSILWLAKRTKQILHFGAKSWDLLPKFLIPPKILVHVQSQQGVGMKGLFGLFWVQDTQIYGAAFQLRSFSYRILKVPVAENKEKQRDLSRNFLNDVTKLLIPGQVCGLSSPEDHKLSFLTALLKPGKC